MIYNTNWLLFDFIRLRCLQLTDTYLEDTFLYFNQLFFSSSFGNNFHLVWVCEGGGGGETRSNCWSRAGIRCSTSMWTKQSIPAGVGSSGRTSRNSWCRRLGGHCSSSRTRCRRSVRRPACTSTCCLSERCRSHWIRWSWPVQRRRCGRNSHAGRCRSTWPAGPGERPVWTSLWPGNTYPSFGPG